MIPGSVIIRIPKKPMMTANHLKIPTFSFNRKIDNIVVNIGAAKEMLTTVAKGNFLKAINIDNKAIKVAADICVFTNDNVKIEKI